MKIVRIFGMDLMLIGVSGNTPQEDEDIAKVGAAAATAAIQGGEK